MSKLQHSIAGSWGICKYPAGLYFQHAAESHAVPRLHVVPPAAQVLTLVRLSYPSATGTAVSSLPLTLWLLVCFSELSVVT